MSIYDDVEGLENYGNADVCPSCGAILDGYSDLGDGCNDPMGCGAMRERQSYDDESYDEEEDDGLEELNFDN